MSQAQQAFSAVPSALSSAAAPAQALSPLDLINLLGSLSGILVDPELSAAGLVVDSTALPYDVVGALTGFHTDDIVSGWAGIQSWPGMAAVPPTPFPVITNLNSPVSAGMGTANVVGKMSVPTAWAMAAPEIRPLAVVLPAAGVAAAETGASAGSVFSQMALAGMAGRALAGSTGAGGAGGAGAAGNREGSAHASGRPPRSRRSRRHLNRLPCRKPLQAAQSRVSLPSYVNWPRYATRESSPTKNSPSRNGVCFRSEF